MSTAAPTAAQIGLNGALIAGRTALSAGQIDVLNAVEIAEPTAARTAAQIVEPTDAQTAALIAAQTVEQIGARIAGLTAAQIAAFAGMAIAMA